MVWLILWCFARIWRIGCWAAGRWSTIHVMELLAHLAGSPVQGYQKACDEAVEKVNQQ